VEPSEDETDASSLEMTHIDQNVPLSLQSLNVLQYLNNAVPISQNTHCTSITKTNMIVLFRAVITDYPENHAKHINIILCAKC
jgi:hypothetical protein